MAQIYVRYNPYKLETQILANGKPLEEDSALYKNLKGKRLQEWVGKFPEALSEEFNTRNFEVEFKGLPLDWDDFEDAFKRAGDAGIISNPKLKFLEGKTDESINEEIVRVFNELQDGPVEDFRDEKLVRAFENINGTVFPINVIATMSSGKSTLINALLGKKLMPSKNEACTATITEILDNDNEQFTAVVYDENNVVLREISDLDYPTMVALNDNNDVHKIAAEGNIPFLEAKDMSLLLVDTPGPNNSQSQAHTNTTYKAINNDANNLILYVLNGTQLSTVDDHNLLKYVADQIKKGGKLVRDRFIFVINKMDCFNPEEESIEDAIEAAKKYLGNFGIDDPQIFPCSAFTALNIRAYFDGIDINNMSRAQEKELPVAARDTLPMIDKFIDNESMHLEQYSTLSPSAQSELEYKLAQAQKEGNIQEQALIHCGVYSIEAAIKAYVKKYAKTKKIKDLVESFSEVLESNRTLQNAKKQVALDKGAMEECEKRTAVIQAKISSGKEAEEFKAKVKALNPIPNIEGEAKKLRTKVEKNTSQIFASYGDTIKSKDEAKRLVKQFSTVSSDAIAELTSELQSVISKEIVDAGKSILDGYQQKLLAIDESSGTNQLEFSTTDLIKGALSGMLESTKEWSSDAFATNTVEEVGETTYEDREYRVKTGQKAKKVADGTTKVKVGTKKVVAGSHREKVGTRKVVNPEKSHWYDFWKIFTPDYINEPIYNTVLDYRDEDVYETIIKYKTVMEDVYDIKKERVEHFSVETSVIQTGLIIKLRKTLDEGISGVKDFAKDQIDNMKKQFSLMFDKLDAVIKKKYDELNKSAEELNSNKAAFEENQRLLEWIEGCQKEIDDILEI